MFENVLTNSNRKSFEIRRENKAGMANAWTTQKIDDFLHTRNELISFNQHVLRMYNTFVLKMLKQKKNTKTSAKLIVPLMMNGIVFRSFVRRFSL